MELDCVVTSFAHCTTSHMPARRSRSKLCRLSGSRPAWNFCSINFSCTCEYHSLPSSPQQAQRLNGSRPASTLHGAVTASVCPPCAPCIIRPPAHAITMIMMISKARAVVIPNDSCRLQYSKAQRSTRTLVIRQVDIRACGDKLVPNVGVARGKR